ncbi:unnamed protein product [Vitrella brassicaformis CCMP3155]|uniref:Uncharacterized protein n=1 Tax=Vitrella brassicaformis (strain CCMP3155) TaxID=1169540 RepID=A0A0G4F8A0_VITBC|nr:unnamed protein product [Vitrella brassicaformis CCMP3155]|mmetsp:Transcript_48836/g.122309  ORF Transcript_48836/g.122309 Transcript_48836/m.122309 type:complete len:380 (-) Transcript_48836:83-1222(-)|eukprot:CEM08214.1 unnamed protein product [Vitrella brassicaformis CCMP3155]
MSSLRLPIARCPQLPFAPTAARMLGPACGGARYFAATPHSMFVSPTANQASPMHRVVLPSPSMMAYVGPDGFKLADKYRCLLEIGGVGVRGAATAAAGKTTAARGAKAAKAGAKVSTSVVKAAQKLAETFKTADPNAKVPSGDDRDALVAWYKNQKAAIKEEKEAAKASREIERARKKAKAALEKNIITQMPSDARLVGWYKQFLKDQREARLVRQAERVEETEVRKAEPKVTVIAAKAKARRLSKKGELSTEGWTNDDYTTWYRGVLQELEDKKAFTKLKQSAKTLSKIRVKKGEKIGFDPETADDRQLVQWYKDLKASIELQRAKNAIKKVKADKLPFKPDEASEEQIVGLYRVLQQEKKQNEIIQGQKIKLAHMRG